MLHLLELTLLILNIIVLIDNAPACSHKHADFALEENLWLYVHIFLNNPCYYFHLSYELLSIYKLLQETEGRIYGS